MPPVTEVCRSNLHSCSGSPRLPWRDACCSCDINKCPVGEPTHIWPISSSSANRRQMGRLMVFIQGAGSSITMAVCGSYRDALIAGGKISAQSIRWWTLNGRGNKVFIMVIVELRWRALTFSSSRCDCHNAEVNTCHMLLALVKGRSLAC